MIQDKTRVCLDIVRWTPHVLKQARVFLEHFYTMTTVTETDIDTFSWLLVLSIVTCSWISFFLDTQKKPGRNPVPLPRTRHALENCPPQHERENKSVNRKAARVEQVITPVEGSIFGSLSQTHISKSECKNDILRSSLLDIQVTLLCVCGVDSFIPELEHLIEKLFHGLFSKKKPLKSDSWI